MHLLTEWRGYVAIGAVLSAPGLGYASRAGIFSGRLTPSVLVDRQQGSTVHAGFRLAIGERWRTAMNITPVLAVRDVEAFYAQRATEVAREVLR